MFSSLIAALNSLSYFGVHDTMNTKLARSIRMTNIVSLTYVIFTFLYFFTLYRIGIMFIIYYVIPLTLIFSSISGINKLGYYNASRLLLLSTINVSIFICAVSLSEAAQIQNVFLFTLITPLMLFNVKETKWIVLCVFQPILLWFLLILVNYNIPPQVLPKTTIAPESVVLIVQTISVTNALLLFYCIYFMFWSYQKAEDKLLDATKTAERARTATLAAKAIAEQAQADAKHAHQVKNEFLAMISHEIRTPLNGILGMTDLLAEKMVEKTQWEYCQIILSSAKLLLTILNDILDFEKIRAKQITLDSQPFNVRIVIEETIALMRPIIEKKQLQLTLNFDTDCPPYLVGDAVRFKQVILNLLGNASKFTLRGYIHVSVEAIEITNKQACLCITVTDTGIGIAKENLQKILNPFSQIESFIQRKVGGTGLGLAICNTMATLMNGEITVESTMGQGSLFRFFLRLPLAKPPSLKPKPAAANDLSTVPTYHRIHALVVEDHDVNQKVIEILLTKLGITIDMAENGQIAVDKYQVHPYDIVFMDCAMPIMDGFEATKAIRQFEIDNKVTPTPIVALTANTDVRDKDHCIAVGMTQFINKPVTLEHVVAVLQLFFADRAHFSKNNA